MPTSKPVAPPFDFTALVRSAADAQDFGPGEVIVEQDADGDCMYVLLDGTVEVLVSGRAVSVLGAGNVFGEMSIINDEKRSATVRAKTQARVVPITKKRFLFLTEQTPFFALHMMRLLSDRLHRMNQFT